MPRCKVGDICKFIRGFNTGKLCVILEPTAREDVWFVELLQPSTINQIFGMDTPRPCSAGQKGYVSDNFLQQVPPPDQEDMTETTKELEHA